MNEAKDELLASVRRALGNARVPAVTREYRGPTGERGAELVDLFCERVTDYGATVHRLSAGRIEDRLAARCGALGVRRLALPPGLSCRPVGPELVIDQPALTAAELDTVDAALTGAALAIAETGTLIFDGGPDCGRRLLTLVPDLHLCVLSEDDVVASVPDAIALLDGSARDGKPLVFVSGPSATSDIELKRVEGVHGPRRLEVFVLARVDLGA